MHGGCSRLPWGAPSRPAPPRCRSLCCRLMASALFGMRAAPSRRNGGPRPSSALPLNRARRPRFADGGVRWGQKPARPLRGSAAPPCARWPRTTAASGHRGASSVVSRPCPVRAAVGRLRSRRPRRRPRPRRSARATKVGGLAPAAFGRRAAAAARPSAPAPPPGFGPGAGLFCFRCGGFGDCAACGRR